MIFVTVGTQDQDFSRLLIEIERLIRIGVICEPVIAQSGQTDFQSDLMEVVTSIPIETFQIYLEQSQLVITHGGVGTILSALQLRKKTIAVPRKASYGEHESDHQREIVEHFDQLGYIVGCNEVEQLQSALTRVQSFEPKIYHSHNQAFCQLMKDWIDN